MGGGENNTSNSIKVIPLVSGLKNSADLKPNHAGTMAKKGKIWAWFITVAWLLVCKIMINANQKWGLNGKEYGVGMNYNAMD